MKLVERHAEEAAFLWLLRRRAVHAPHYHLSALADLDERIEAHLDGLRVAGDSGWQVCEAALANGPGEVFAAAVLAFASGQQDRIEQVLQAASNPEQSRGLVSALGWLPHEQAEKPIRQLLDARSPALRRVAIAAAAVHRRDPGQALENAFADSDAALRARALRAVGELGLARCRPALREALRVEEDACRFWAAWSAVLVARDAYALNCLLALLDGSSPFRDRAVLLLGRALPLELAREMHRSLAGLAGGGRMAVAAAGASGNPELIPWLIEQMNIPPLARVAGEAFTLITGVDLVAEHLDGGKPEGFQSGPTDDPLDENVAPDPDEQLPWPDAEAVARWWERQRGRFARGTRYLLGKPVRPESLREALGSARQRQRAAAALELALLGPGRGLFEVRAAGFRQQHLLRKAANGAAISS